MKPDPLVLSWRGLQVRVRHDDPRLTPYSPGVSRLRSAIEQHMEVLDMRQSERSDAESVPVLRSVGNTEAG